MPQPPPKAWKQAIFSLIASTERAARRRPASTLDGRRQLRNFLVLQYESPLGSVVHATPFFEALKTAIPEAHVTVAASAMAASVLANSPYIDRCVITPDPLQSFPKAVRAVRHLFQTMPPGPRCIVTTIGNQRTRIALLSLLAGNAIRAGYTLAPAISTLPLRFQPERGQIEGNLDILRAIGHEVTFCEPSIFFTQQDLDNARHLLGKISESNNAPRIVFVTQNSGGQRNQWSTERFQQVVLDLEKRCGAVPIFVGTISDAPAIEILRRPFASASISVAGKTTISQLAALLALCDLVVSLDTGTFHVARAVGLPGVVIAPAWQSPLEWLPMDHSHYRVLRGPSIATAPAEYWIEEVGADQVTDAAIDLLEMFPPASLCRAARMDRSTSHSINN